MSSANYQLTATSNVTSPARSFQYKGARDLKKGYSFIVAAPSTGGPSGQDVLGALILQGFCCEEAEAYVSGSWRQNFEAVECGKLDQALNTKQFEAQLHKTDYSFKKHMKGTDEEKVNKPSKDYHQDHTDNNNDDDDDNKPGLTPQDESELMNISFSGTSSEQLKQAGRHYEKVCAMTPRLSSEIKAVNQAKETALEIIADIEVPEDGDELTKFMVVNEIFLDKSGLFHSMNNKSFKKLNKRYMENLQQPKFTRNAIVQKACDRLIEEKHSHNDVVEKVMRERLEDAAKEATLKSLNYIDECMTKYTYAEEYLKTFAVPADRAELKACIELLLDKISFSKKFIKPTTNPMDGFNQIKDTYKDTRREIVSNVTGVQNLMKNSLSLGAANKGSEDIYSSLQDKYQYKLKELVEQIDVLYPEDQELQALKKKCQGTMDKNRHIKFYVLLGILFILGIMLLVVPPLGIFVLVLEIIIVATGLWKKITYFKKLGEGSIFDKKK